MKVDKHKLSLKVLETNNFALTNTAVAGQLFHVFKKWSHPVDDKNNLAEVAEKIIRLDRNDNGRSLQCYVRVAFSH